jgi:hypothetical protein
MVEELAVEDEQVAVRRRAGAHRARLACDEAELPEAGALPRHPQHLGALPHITAAGSACRGHACHTSMCACVWRGRVGESTPMSCQMGCGEERRGRGVGWAIESGRA